MKCEFSRREFLVATVAAAAVIASGCSTCARNSEANSKAIFSVIATKNPDGTLRVPGGGKLQPGTVLAFTFPPDDEIHGVMFFTREAELRALSTRCTHAACTVAWQSDGDTEILKCPCHGSRFDTAGQVLNGPAKLPLARYAVRVEGDDAIVTLPS
jgi:Rieske Fe-S protein